MGIFKKIVEVWGSISLIKRIVIGLAVGIALALAWPNIAAIELLGTLFGRRWPHARRSSYSSS